eukprot:2735434-Prymnesium_polylepis.2
MSTSHSAQSVAHRAWQSDPVRRFPLRHYRPLGLGCCPPRPASGGPQHLEAGDTVESDVRRPGRP